MSEAMKTLNCHPAANLLPNMEEEEFAALKASIKEVGQKMPILLLNGQIIDGRHRYRACCELGIEPIVKEIDDKDPIGLVLTLNLHRRHLNKGQIAIIAAKLTARNRPGKPDLQNAKNSHFKTTQEAADAVKVARKYINEAMAILEYDEAYGTDMADRVTTDVWKLSETAKVIRESKRRKAAEAVHKQTTGPSPSSTPIPSVPEKSTQAKPQTSTPHLISAEKILLSSLDIDRIEEPIPESLFDKTEIDELIDIGYEWIRKLGKGCIYNRGDGFWVIEFWEAGYEEKDAEGRFAIMSDGCWLYWDNDDDDYSSAQFELLVKFSGVVL